MKVLLAVLGIVCVLGLVNANAEMTGDATWQHIGSGGAWLFDHEHNYVDKDTPYTEDEKSPEIGIGVDVVVYEFDGVVNTWGMDSIELQNKYDLNQGNYEGYVVAKVNAWRPIKKLLGLK